MNTPNLGKVSICIPTYNRPALLEKLLDSILSQTYTNYEIIITDNSDTLETKDLIEKCYKDECIHYHKNEKNLGMDGNSLRALSYVNGEYFTFTPDDDIWIDPKKLEKQVLFLQSNNNIDCCFSNALHIHHDGTKHKNQFHSDYSKQNTCEIIYPISLQLDQKQPPEFVCILTGMMRHTMLNIFTESWKYGCEEYFMWYLGGSNTKIGFCYDQLVAIRDGDHNWQVNDENGTLTNYRKNDRRRAQQIIDIWSDLLKTYPTDLIMFDKKVEKNVFKMLIRLLNKEAFGYTFLFTKLGTFDFIYLYSYYLMKELKKGLKWIKSR
ncbi:MAG: glycosyltransferase [Sulfuricurvum sp.]|uniref:glycosyltransferase family 2 protein n=1 Tax=Sulfuricurvum sp. TaxID=2025608 RepID=UPI0027337D32|nr:glycosyltransferase [Sulfuricurvum sp.]MDP3291169.1 glycosyltransferase [Sulfuricurvum sp.]